MLTREELLSFNPEYGASSLKKRSQIKLYNSHLEALDEIDRLTEAHKNWKHEAFATKDMLVAANKEIDRLTAELAAAPETTKRVLIGNIDDFGAISQCEKCYKMLDVFMKFCPDCGRKIEGEEA